MASIGKIIYEDFTVVNHTTRQLVPNIPLVEFSHKLYQPNGNENLSITISFQELGNGNYRANFTPNLIGQWLLCIYHNTYFPLGKNSSITVSEKDIDDVYVISSRILGLSQENYFLDNNIYDVDGRLTFGRIRTYTNSMSVGTTNNILAVYNIEANYNVDGSLNTYSVSKI